MAEQSLLQQGLLSQEETEEFRKIFLMIDYDGSGYLSLENLHSFAQEISKNTSLREQDTYQLFMHMDYNKDGKVSWENFLHYICN